MAVIRRQYIIQNAIHLYNFTKDNLQLPLEGVSFRRRVFFYVENSDRNEPHRQLKEIKGNRTTQNIWARGQGRHLEIRDLLCYCEQCLIGDYDQCVNTSRANPKLRKGGSLLQTFPKSGKGSGEVLEILKFKFNCQISHVRMANLNKFTSTSHTSSRY